MRPRGGSDTVSVVRRVCISISRTQGLEAWSLGVALGWRRGQIWRSRPQLSKGSSHQRHRTTQKTFTDPSSGAQAPRGPSVHSHTTVFPEVTDSP